VTELIIGVLFVAALAAGGYALDKRPTWFQKLSDLAFGPNEKR
jgi:hypothetical protein